MADVERRSFGVSQLRAVGSSSPRIEGYAAVFNQLSEDLGGFVEQIDPAAFDEAVAGDVRALWNHDPNYVLGRTSSGTLKLQVDQNGLRVVIHTPDTQWARDAVTSIRRGDVSQMSFKFRTLKDRWAQGDAGKVIRTLLKVEIYDVSPVTFPAYPQTSVQARSTAKAMSRETHHQAAARARHKLALMKMRLDLMEAEWGMFLD